jgi:hypothetical protein
VVEPPLTWGELAVTEMRERRIAVIVTGRHHPLPTVS